MSFLQEIERKKSSLKPQETTVTLPSGEKYLERKNQDGGSVSTKLSETTAGFVIDTKPDLQIAKITSKLFLSSQDPVTDFDLLEKIGITNVLSLGVEIPETQRSARIDYRFIEMLDIPETSLAESYRECFDYVDSATGKVLIHCNAGVSRSPSLVIAYLMERQNMSFEEAFGWVKAKRDIRPNDGFLKQLKQIDKTVDTE